MSARYITLLISLLLTFFSCNKTKDNKVKLAQVYNKYLFLDDIKNILPENISKEDSQIIINNKIDFWVKKQILLKRAELNLNEQQKDINAIVEDYRASLLIEKYKQEYIKQELDTQITEVEIEKYYHDYPESFNTNEELVKALFFKISVKSDSLSSYMQAYYSSDEQKLIGFSGNENVVFNDFSKKWVKISNVLNLLPDVITNPEAILKLSKKIETRDKEFFYFVFFKDYILKGETIPLELAKDRIKIILLNKRKTNLINDLEKKIYQSDIKNKNIKIFTE